MKYAIYTVATGVISRIITAQDPDHVDYNTGSGEAALAVDANQNDATHYVSGGAFVAYPAQPTPNHTWNSSTHAWVDGRSLVIAIKAAAQRVKDGRDAYLQTGLPTTYGTFDFSVQSQTKLQWLVNQAQQDSSFTCTWQLADDSNVTLTAADILSVQSQAIAWLTSVHTKAVTLKQSAYACTTNAQADAIQWVYP